MDSLIASALTAITRSTIVEYNDKEYVNAKSLETMSLDSFHLIELARGPVPTIPISAGPPDSNEFPIFVIFVRTLTGKILEIVAKATDTILNIHEKIQEQEGIPIDQQRLVFAQMQMDSFRTLADYKISDGCTIHLVLKLKGGGGAKVIKMPLDLRSPKFDCDFTKINDKDKIFTRGFKIYKRPCGWQRFALNVLDKYEENNWLGVGRGINNFTDSVNGEWPVSYHVTEKRNLKSIAEEGFLLCKGKRFKFGMGIYTTPDIEIAEFYATEFTHNGAKFKTVLQNRVNPNTTIKVTEGKKSLGEYWISENAEDVRPYGICIRKC